MTGQTPAVGYCPHCGSGDAGPTPEAYGTARQRAVRLQARIDNARDWARRNLTDQQHAGLLGVLRGDEPHACRPGAGYYWCPTAGEVESDCHGGFGICCDQPERHEPLAMCGATQGCGHPADSHSVYGCEDHCACEWMPAAKPTEACCVCGGGSVVYRNYKEQPFCWPCADCQCAQNPCVRTGVNDPAVTEEAAERSDTTQRARVDAALKQILADANHHDLCATESKTLEGGVSHSSIAAGLRIAARHLLATQKETPDA
jgi:hypothetical protein